MLGTQHPQVASGLDNLAEVCYQQGRYQEAKSLLKRSLAIRERAVGSDHPSMAETLKGYAQVLRKMKQKAEAISLEARAKDILMHCGPHCQTQHTVDVHALR